MDLVILIRTILKKIWLLLLVPLLTGIIVFVLTINLKKQYLSKAQLATGFTVKDLSNQDFNIMTADIKFNNLIENILSNQVVSQTGYKLLIHDLNSKRPYISSSKLSDSTRNIISKLGKEKISSILKDKLDRTSTLSSEKQDERFIFEILEDYGYDYESIQEMSRVNRAGYSDYVNVVAITENAELSSFIVNSICEDFLKINSATRNSKNTGSLDTLNNQVIEKRELLSKKQKELTDFKTMIGILDLKSSGSSKLDLAGNFEQALSDERKSLVESTSQLNEVNSRLRSLGSGEDNTSSQLLSLRRQINELEQAYKNSKDPSILSDLNELKKRRDNLAASYDIGGLKDDKLKIRELSERASDLRAKINSNRLNINNLERRIKALNSNVSSYAGKEAELNALEQEVTIAQNEYSTVNERYNNAVSLNSSLNTGGITQSLVGQPAIKPETSKRLLIILAAMIATFTVCFVVIVLIEYFDTSFKTPINFIKKTQLNIIGTIPFIKFKRNEKNKNDNNKLFSDKNEEIDSLVIDGKLKNELNKIRYELESTNAKLFLFTSMREQTGKTKILSLLSKLNVKNQKRILIIDSNFDNNEITRNVETDISDQHTNENHSNSKKDLLIEVSAQNSQLVYHDNIKETSRNLNVDIIGCKQNHYLESIVYPEHYPLNQIDHLKDKYDYIFIEGPCLNKFTDSKELSKYVDKVIVVSSVDDVVRYVDKQSIKFLKSLDQKFMGVILNRVDKIDLN